MGDAPEWRKNPWRLWNYPPKGFLMSYTQQCPDTNQQMFMLGQTYGESHVEEAASHW